MTSFRRCVKNVIKNYTEAEVKVREATSNDPWGPSSTLMSEISDLTYNIVALGDIMRIIWKRLNDHGKNWRHVYKSLVLLDYLIKNGNEKVAQQCKEHIVAVQTLKDFQYIEENKDQGVNVREKSKHIVSLLCNDELFIQERAKSLKCRERYTQSVSSTDGDMVIYSSVIKRTEGLESARPVYISEEELQEHEEEHEEEIKRKKSEADTPKKDVAASAEAVELVDFSSEDSPCLLPTKDPWSEFLPTPTTLFKNTVHWTTPESTPTNEQNNPWAAFHNPKINPWAAAFNMSPIDHNDWTSISPKVSKSGDGFEIFMSAHSARDSKTGNRDSFW